MLTDDYSVVITIVLRDRTRFHMWPSFWSQSHTCKVSYIHFAQMWCNHIDSTQTDGKVFKASVCVHSTTGCFCTATCYLTPFEKGLRYMVKKKLSIWWAFLTVIRNMMMRDLWNWLENPKFRENWLNKPNLCQQCKTGMLLKHCVGCEAARRDGTKPHCTHNIIDMCPGKGSRVRMCVCLLLLFT